jgi:hypothetical protein
MGTSSPAQTDVWWPRFGESNPAHALEVSSAEHGGLRVAATAWRWGGELPVTIDIVSRIANELGARTADRGRQ